MKIRQVVPYEEEIELSELLTRISQSGRCTRAPFHPEITSFCANLSQALFKDTEARRFPELQALAFGMRKAQLVRFQQEFSTSESGPTLRVPRGLVFHVPPANVDTIFIYSWLFSVLTGNRNIIRLSPRASYQSHVIWRIFNETLAEAGRSTIANTVMVQYDHELEITGAISALCDVRVIWGGDSTVQEVRSVPLLPHAKELVFADRYSYSAIQAVGYLALDAGARRALAERFYNDMFWFDQMACSSPQLLLWCGDVHDCRLAGPSFYKYLQEQIEHKGYTPQAAMRMNKFTFACRAILDKVVPQYTEYGDQLVLLDLGSLAAVRREHCGGGLLLQFHASNITELADFVQRADQTLTYFGFSETELKRLVHLINGRGLDRIVPIGQALSFQRFWDGYDLLQELTRHVYVGNTDTRP